MSDSNQSIVLKGLIEQANTGDLNARRKLLEHAYDRLCQLAGKMLVESFPTLRNRHEVNSIVHETWLKLDQALDKTQPPTVADFFRLAAFKIRQVLLDMVDRHRKASQREQFGLEQGLGSVDFASHSNNTYDPRKLGEWTEFHQRVERLDADERSVFELHYYLDIPQTEIAELLNLHPRKVSYLWVSATENLAIAFRDGAM
jgi:RNA polymerase sigma factor (sigma-70 family)